MRFKIFDLIKKQLLKFIEIYPKHIESKSMRKNIRTNILRFETALGKIPDAMFGDCCPLKHTFVDGAYVREITMPKGLLLTSKIHKKCHPYFILKGEVSVLTEEGTKRIKAPYSGITPAGTKRILYIHEDTVWTTVHITKETDLDKIESEIIAKNFKDMGIEVDEFKALEEDKEKLIKFMNSIPELERANKEELCLVLK